ncbi:acetate--CoA ligase family protein [Saccharopolyspora shandongensis]|uniref:acetate--CoA ligase family protein n=1 Tax=Saccharopolyspora shandongensis TaxID=418495 RepID=UPI003441A8DC
MSVDTSRPSIQDGIATLVSEARSRESAMFTEAQAKSLLAAFGIDVPRGVQVSDGELIPEHLGESLVVKAISATLVHKSDAGGVRVGVSREQVAEVTDQMRKRLAASGHRLSGLLVEEMVPAGHEVIVGATKTPDLGWSVDYAFVALSAARVGEALLAAAGRVRFAQVIASGFGETEEGKTLEKTLVETVRRAGIRLIGPNCLGTHASAGRLSFIPDAPLTPGVTAVVSQSGGLSVDILRVGAMRGIDFHSVVSIGNGADVNAAELVASHLADDDVRVIGLYLESLAAAREVLDVLTTGEVRKPVVLLAGGRTSEGSRAATSHTGALAGNHRLWQAIARQAGMTLVDSLEDFASALHALSTIDLDIRSTGRQAILFGNGGGASVLGADALDRQGLSTSPLADSVIRQLDGLGLPPGNGLRNPIDVPAGTLAVRNGQVAEDMLKLVLAGSEPDILISHLNVGIIQRNLGESHGDVTGTIIDSIVHVRDEANSNTHHLLVLKTDGSQQTEELITGYAHRARSSGIPVFAAFEDAALAARAVLEQTHQGCEDDGRR